MVIMDMDMDTYKCPTCSKCFKYESQFNRHCKAGKCYKTFKCTYCDKSYSYLKSLNKHIQKCHNGTGIGGIGKENDNSRTISTKKIEVDDNQSWGTNNRVSSVKSGNGSGSGNGIGNCDKDTNQTLAEVVTQMKIELEETKRDLNRVKEKPTYVNIENFNANITVVSRDFFAELYQSLGSEEALRVINQASRDNQPLKLVDKLYIEGRDSNQYPIACKDRFHFRYLDDNKDLIDDKDGSRITRQIIGGVQDAMMSANNKLILQGIRRGNTDFLFSEQYNLPKIQDNLLNINPNNVKNELVQRFTNPKHPFFRDNI